MKQELISKTLVLTILSVICWQLASHGQTNIELRGLVKDTSNQGIPYANILAKNLTDNSENISFAITNQEGFFNLKLNTNTSYRVQISFTGYSSLIDTLNLSKDTFKEYTLIEQIETLKEIIINKRLAIKKVGDTTYYRPEDFMNGREKKLKDVLKKLPGITLDKKGNVKVNNKEVTRFFVDGKEFFNGDEKLGVNNIPAGVIDEIVAIDNYHDISFLSNFSNSEELALNIKLKKDKKRFVFGNATIGTGPRDEKRAKGTFFYYSPKNSINTIGDYNNIGESALTLEDIISFTDFKNQYFDNNNTFINDELLGLLNQEGYLQSNQMAAGHTYAQLSSKSSINLYAITTQSFNREEETNEITYLTSNNIFENRLTENENNSSLNVINGQFKFKKKKLTLRYNFNFSTQNLSNSQSTLSETNDTSESILGNQETSLLSLKNDITTAIQLSKKSSLLANANLDFQRRLLNGSIFSESNEFPSILPIINEPNIILNQLRENHKKKWSAQMKWIYALNRSNLFTSFIATDNINHLIQTIDEQVLANGNVNSFDNSGFNNNTNLILSNQQAGFNYTHKKNSFYIEINNRIQLLSWGASESIRQIKTQWIPEVNLQYEKNAKKFRIKFKQDSKGPHPSLLLNRLNLKSFNQVRQGGHIEESDLSRSISASFFKSNILKERFLGCTINLKNTLRTNTFVNSIAENDIIGRAQNIDVNDLSISTNIFYDFLIRSFKIGLSVKHGYLDYSRPVNSINIDFIQNRYQMRMKLKYNSDKIEIDNRFNISYSILKNQNQKNRIFNLNNNTDLIYYLNQKWELAFSHNLDYVRNSNRWNGINNTSSSISFEPNESSFSFKLEVSNLWNQKNYFTASNFALNTQSLRIRQLLRQTLLSVNYSF